MVRTLFKKLIVPMICLASLSVLVSGVNSSYAENTKNKSGLNFYVPEDWPIEKRAGILGPIPTEEYVSIKFKATEEEFQVIKEDLASKFAELQLNMKKMEINFSKEIQKTQLQADSQGGTREDLTDVLNRLSALEIEQGRLDRKITSKASFMKTETRKTATIISSIEKKIKEFQAEIYKLEETIDYVMDEQMGSR